MSQLHNYRGIPYSNHCSLPLSCFVQLFLAHPSNHWTMISISNLFIPFQGLGTPIWSQNESNLLVKQQPSTAITSHMERCDRPRFSQLSDCEPSSADASNAWSDLTAALPLRFNDAALRVRRRNLKKAKDRSPSHRQSPTVIRSSHVQYSPGSSEVAVISSSLGYIGFIFGLIRV